VDYRVVARLGGLLYGAGAVATLLAAQFRMLTDFERLGVITVCLSGIVLAAAIWALPWQRWPRSRTLVLLPIAFLFVSIGHSVALNPFEFTAYLLAGFVWIGIAHPRGTSVWMLPVLWIAYLLPIALGRPVDINQVLSGLVTTTVLCLIVGETLAWLVASLRRVHEELATQRIGARYRALVRNVSDLVVVVGPDSGILFIAPSVERMLGYQPAELTSRRLTELFADSAAPEALRLFERLSRQPGASATQEWRVSHADGSTRVIEAAAVNLAEDPDIGGIVLTGRDVTERHALETQLSHEALHDSLTGLANRILFQDRVAHAIDRAQRRTEQMAVLFLDLDEFKDVNDSLGHQAGDTVLRVVAERLREVVRSSDTVARLGGDEFAILVEDADGAEDVDQLAERLLEAVHRPIVVDDTELVVGVSVGIVLAEAETEGAEALVRDADIAMYAAKELGKDRVEIFHPAMQARISERLHLVTDLRHAIDDGELEVVYQPFVELATERMIGVEALVRWRHPERGLLQPGAFIGAAEESGLIVTLGDHVLREACAAARRWSSQGAGFELVSVNLSPRQFGEARLVADIEAALTDTGLSPELLVLEITESVLIGDMLSTREKLNALRAMGVRIAIDDFGMGYSSLNYLRALPVDILKIDRSFVTGLGTGDSVDALVEAIVEMARVMGLETIAEAVEQPCEAERLRELGARLAQGFYFARPMSAADIGQTWASDAADERLPGLTQTAGSCAQSMKLEASA
jgi:diguanylate cyclase (GGDEF)-like protein/PAS domain S-box-containing protein